MAEAASLDKLVLDPFGLRIRYDDKVIKNLAGSILQNGIITALLVRPKGGRYEIIDGNYRFKALQHIGWEKPVPVNVEEMSDEEALLKAVVSNWHRTNFRFGDKANSVKKLKEKNLSNEKICVRLEIKPKTLLDYLSYVNDVPAEVKDIISSADEKVSRRHARALVKLRKHPAKQRKLAERIVTEKLDGAEAGREAEKILNPPPEKTEVETGLSFKCPVCNEGFILIHVNPKGGHKLAKVQGH